MPRLIYIPIITILIFGIIFISILAHEGMHVIQSKSPESICYDFNSNLIMHVEHADYTNDSFLSFLPITEKWATIAQFAALVILSMTTGALLMYVAKVNK